MSTYRYRSFTCYICKQKHDSSKYSRNQLKRGFKRKCTQCIKGPNLCQKLIQELNASNHNETNAVTKIIKENIVTTYDQKPPKPPHHSSKLQNITPKTYEYDKSITAGVVIDYEYCKNLAN